MQTILKDMGAEAAYFTTISGQRGGYIVVDVKDASQIPGIAEPLFLWLNARVDFLPVMLPEDLACRARHRCGGPEMWGSKA